MVFAAKLYQVVLDLPTNSYVALPIPALLSGPFSDIMAASAVGAPSADVRTKPGGPANLDSHWKVGTEVRNKAKSITHLNRARSDFPAHILNYDVGMCRSQSSRYDELRVLSLKTCFGLAAFVLASCSSQSRGPSAPATQNAAVRTKGLEGYPSSIIQAQNDRANSVVKSSGKFSAHPNAVISISRQWPVSTFQAGSTITVAFLGGSEELRNQIARAITPWLNAANVHFDFGPLASAGKFREWKTSDKKYAGDIRIAFQGGEEGGYWSLVGKDSINPALVKPNKPSMNFEGFTDSLPSDWQATVLHEFGHSLGFEHEHQSPIATCNSEFRWNDDPGYVPTRDIYQQFIPDSRGSNPGIYRVLGGPPNIWSTDQINFNLRQLASSADYFVTTFDDHSIMKYQFPAWMFLKGQQSAC